MCVYDVNTRLSVTVDSMCERLGLVSFMSISQDIAVISTCL